MFIFLGYCWASWVWWVYDLKKLCPLFLQIFFSITSLVFGTQLHCLIYCYKSLVFSFFFVFFLSFYFFPLCFILDIFYCCVFILTVQPVVNPPSVFFIWDTVFFISRSSIWALKVILHFLLNTSMSCSTFLSILSIFAVALNIFVCQVLCLCLFYICFYWCVIFLIIDRISLLMYMPGKFSLYVRHCEF